MGIILPQQVLVKWTSANKKYFQGILCKDGNPKYIFTKINDEFLVNVEDLKPSSHFEVFCNCDYAISGCETANTPKKIQYKVYVKNAINGVIKKYSCNNFACRDTKKRESMLKTYGVEHQYQLEKTKEKAKRTRLEKHGEHGDTLITYEQLYDYYVNQKIGSKKIAKIHNCSDSYVRLLRRRWNIPTFIEEIDYSKIISKEELKKMFEIDKLTAIQIAKRYDCNKNTIYKLADKYEIKPHSNKIIFYGNVEHDFLHDLYIKREMSTKEIAKILGSSDTTVRTLLKDFNIPIRNSQILKHVKLDRQTLEKYHHEDFLTLDKIGEKYGVSGSAMNHHFKKLNIEVFLASELKAKEIRAKITPIVLRKLYYEEFKTSQEIGYIYNLSATTILNLMHEYNIKPDNRKREVMRFYSETDEKTIIELYFEEGWTIDGIADMWGISRNVVSSRLDEFGIIKSKKSRDYISANELYNLYYVEKKGISEIGKIYNFDRMTILDLLNHYGFEERHRKFNPTPAKEVINKEKLQELYTDKKMTISEIADLFGYSSTAIRNLMYAYNIEIRSCRGEKFLERDITNYFRSKIYRWKKDSMEACNNKCIITGENFDNIHHLYPYYMIVKEAFEELEIFPFESVGDYTSEELELLGEKVLEIHYRYPLGVCIKKEFHRDFHNKYGINATPKDFEEYLDSL